MARRENRDLHARLTPDIADAWDRMLTGRNVTYTALIEALGQMLADGDDWVPDGAVERARAIDRERRSRR